MIIKSIVLLLVLLLTSCGGYRTTIKEQDNKGFLKFNGNLNNITVLLDDLTKVPIELGVDQYSIKPGQYDIKIYRNEKLIVNRIIIIESKTTYQLEVP